MLAISIFACMNVGITQATTNIDHEEKWHYGFKTYDFITFWNCSCFKLQLCNSMVAAVEHQAHMLSIHLMSWLELTAHELVLSDRFACLGSSLVVVVQVPGEKMGGSIHLSMIISASQAMQTAKAGRYKE
ncbi:hypothetical protein V6N13_079005 [Hibiscus sabdariffa]|uniref:Uncharacterized protein n=1 Tax=Hibiscus sabdariffa TaxID=183260 RepID=A0ABR2RQ90_9ROSI